MPGNPLPRTTARSLSAFLGRCSRGRRGSRWTQVVGMLDVTLDADCHIDPKDTYCSYKIDDPLRSNLATWQYLALTKSQRLVIHPRRRPPRSPRAPSPATKSQSGVTNAIYLQSTHSPLRDESEKAAAVRCHRSVDRVAKHSLVGAAKGHRRDCGQRSGTAGLCLNSLVTRGQTVISGARHCPLRRRVLTPFPSPAPRVAPVLVMTVYLQSVYSSRRMPVEAAGEGSRLSEARWVTV